VFLLFLAVNIDSIFAKVATDHCYNNFDSTAILLETIDSEDPYVIYAKYVWLEHCASYWSNHQSAIEAIAVLDTLPLNDILGKSADDARFKFQLRKIKNLIGLGELSIAKRENLQLIDHLNENVDSSSSYSQNFRSTYLFLAQINERLLNYLEAEKIYHYVLQNEINSAAAQNRDPIIATNYGRLAKVQKHLGKNQKCLNNSLIALREYYKLSSQSSSNYDYYKIDIARLKLRIYQCSENLQNTEYKHYLTEALEAFKEGYAIESSIIKEFADFLMTENGSVQMLCTIDDLIFGTSKISDKFYSEVYGHLSQLLLSDNLDSLSHIYALKSIDHYETDQGSNIDLSSFNYDYYQNLITVSNYFDERSNSELSKKFIDKAATHINSFRFSSAFEDDILVKKKKIKELNDLIYSHYLSESPYELVKFKELNDYTIFWLKLYDPSFPSSNSELKDILDFEKYIADNLSKGIQYLNQSTANIEQALSRTLFLYSLSIESNVSLIFVDGKSDKYEHCSFDNFLTLVNRSKYITVVPDQHLCGKSWSTNKLTPQEYRSSLHNSIKIPTIYYMPP